MPRLPVTDLSTDAIKAFLGITGEITLDEICKSDLVRGEYFDVNYLVDVADAYYHLLSGLAGYPLGPAGIREGVRQDPYNISNFRNYGFDTVGYSMIAFSGTGTQNRILKYNNDEYWNNFYPAPIRDMRSAVRAVDGFMWVGGQVTGITNVNYRGLFRWDGNVWVRFITPQIPGQYVYCIALGTDPYMWIGTDHGFAIYNRLTSEFKSYYIGYNIPSGKLGSDIVTSFVYDPVDHSMWVGTTNGLTHIRNIDNPAEWDFMNGAQMAGSNVKCLAIGPDGQVWAGFSGQGMTRITYFGGVYSYDDINVALGIGIISNVINSIAIEQDNYYVWAATNNGIQYFEYNAGYNNVSHLQIDNGIPSNLANTIAIDHLNRKWIGFDDHIACTDDISSEPRVWGQWNMSGGCPIMHFLIDYEPPQVINEIVIGDQTWMADNWRGNNRFMFPSGTKSKVYNYDEYNREFHGGLFTWRQIKEPGFCPAGYHIPSLSEWNELITYEGGPTVAGDHLKSTSSVPSAGWSSVLAGTDNTSGFGANGSGYTNTLGYYDIGEMCQYWTADEDDAVAENGISIGLYHDSHAVSVESHNKDDRWFSVRMIKDSTEAPPVDYGMLYNWFTVNDNSDPSHDIVYGLLYNWYAVTDARYICASGWHVPTIAEWESIKAYLGGYAIAGGKLKEMGLVYWLTPNTDATNEVGFNGRGSGYRDYLSGVFSEQKEYLWLWCQELESYTLRYNSAVMGLTSGNTFEQQGLSIRPIKDSTALANGQTGTYTGNDGRVYPTICIGTQEWLACNLAETKYRNGDDILEVTDNTEWALLGDTGFDITGTANYVWGSWTSDAQYYLQTFNLAATKYVTSIEISGITPTGNPDLKIRLSIYNAVAGVPTTLIANSINTSIGGSDKIFYFDNVRLVAGNYCFIFSYEDVVVHDASNFFNYEFSSANIYSDGNMAYKTGSGAWQTFSGWDFLFQMRYATGAMCFYDNDTQWG